MDVNDVGIVSATLNNQIRVYPNPTNGQLRIKNYELKENDIIEIYDVVGQKVGANLCVRPINAETITIDISHLASGMYFLKVGNKTARFVKE